MFPSRMIRWTHLALVLSVLACSAACGSSSGGPTSTTTRFVGTVDGTNVVVGLVVTDGQALLFFCGKGETLTTLTHWMHGAVTLGQAFELTDGTASATGTATATTSASHLSGTFMESASGKPMTWSADLVTGGTLAGVYTDQLSEGLVALIVLQSSASATPMAQGAFHDVMLKDAILQVTPLAPLALTGGGLAVDVVVSGATKKVFLEPAVED
jgi:hypothetical protein